MFRLFTLVLVCFLSVAGFSTIALAEPQLLLQGDADQGAAEKRTFTRSQLLERQDRRSITVKDDPAYPGRVMMYDAVPLAALFQGLKLGSDAVIEFKCIDGFAATISQARILNRDPQRSEAFIAIENPKSPWPKVKNTQSSAGPFYLVWLRPELSAITQEEWPFQLAGFQVKGSLRQLYPAIFPAADAGEKVRRGFLSFSRNCFPCHTLNKEGPSNVGPDLNVPMNVTEYIEAKALRKLIRNPQNLRFYPGSRMSSFPQAILPDDELEDLLAYLSHIAGHKVNH